MRPLRAYQSNALDRARSAVRSGSRSPLLVAPCGAGKTRVTAEIMMGTIRKGGSGLWVAPRREILTQARRHLADEGLPDDAPVRVESVQALAEMAELPDATVVAFDEAHHMVTPEWSRVFNYYRGRSLRIGLTATPCRNDGVALGQDGQGFDSLIEVATVAELTALGFLVPCTVYGPPKKLKGIAMTPVRAYLCHSPDGHAIVFCGTLAHAEHVAAEFRSLGIAAEAVDGETTTRERDAAVAAFSAGLLPVLCNVRLFTEGTDLPVADVAIHACGCAHDGAWIQKCGRVLRSYPGKSRALVLDLVGSCLEFGLPSDPREYSLEGRPIRVADGLEPLRQCPKCGGVFRAGLYKEATCPRCGYRLPPRKDPQVRRAELQEVRAGHSVDVRRAAYLALVNEGVSKGYKPGRAAIVFKARYGRFPRAEERTTE